MKSVFQQMVEIQAYQREQGCEVINWEILTDMFPDVEAEAREAGALDDDGGTILGVPFEVKDLARTNTGYLAMTIGPKT